MVVHSTPAMNQRPEKWTTKPSAPCSTTSSPHGCANCNSHRGHRRRRRDAPPPILGASASRGRCHLRTGFDGGRRYRDGRRHLSRARRLRPDDHRLAENTTFMRPVESGDVLVTARVQRRGRNLVFGDIELRDAQNELAAHTPLTRLSTSKCSTKSYSPAAAIAASGTSSSPN